MIHFYRKITTSLCFILMALAAKADITLPTIISDHMVLQQQSEIILWGWASAQENVEVNVSWHNKPFKVQANREGKWQVTVKTLKAGGPHLIHFKGNNKIEVKDIFFGEVWFCSGQSNMEWSVANAEYADSVSRTAANPLIRMFTVQRAVSDTAVKDVKGKWDVNSPTTVGKFSAVAYHFGNELAMRLKVPVGLIHSSWGGTPAEAWVAKSVLADTAYRQVYERQQERERKYAIDLKKDPSNPKLRDPKKDGKEPHVLYNAMLKPLVNYRINGVIWYQGESNASRAFQYRKLFPALIHSWRQEFRQLELPFYFVQIAPYKDQNPEIREAQLMTLKALDNVGMVVTTDVGNCQDIHPRNKIPVGKRLANIALNRNYGQTEISYLNPIYKRFEIIKDQITVYFDTQTDLHVADDKPIREFEIAGTDQVFYPAEAKVIGKTVVVRSNKVDRPVAVRFAWKNCPAPNLFNQSGLPASPFRTDNY